MSTTASRIHHWLGAAGGSRLFLSVKCRNPNEVVEPTIVIQREDGPPETLPGGEVQPGPLVLMLPGPQHAYSVDLQLSFVTDAIVDVTAHVEEPLSGGVHFQRDYSAAVIGKPDEAIGIRFFVTVL